MKGSVLVVGDNSLAALQTVRSLGRAGLDVHLVKFESGSVTKYSRYVRKTYHFGHPLTDTDRFVTGVLAAVFLVLYLVRRRARLNADQD